MLLPTDIRHAEDEPMTRFPTSFSSTYFTSISCIHFNAPLLPRVCLPLTSTQGETLPYGAPPRRCSLKLQNCGIHGCSCLETKSLVATEARTSFETHPTPAWLSACVLSVFCFVLLSRFQIALRRAAIRVFIRVSNALASQIRCISPVECRTYEDTGAHDRRSVATMTGTYRRQWTGMTH